MPGTQIVPAFHGDQLPANLIDASKAPPEFASNAKAANTSRAYQAAWDDFVDWCDREGP